MRVSVECATDRISIPFIYIAIQAQLKIWKKKKICIWGAVFPTETFSAFICASPAMLSQGLVCKVTENIPESLDQSRL